jgi:hypothetical protein
MVGQVRAEAERERRRERALCHGDLKKITVICGRGKAWVVLKHQ